MFDALYPEQAGQALAERARRPDLNAPRRQGGAFSGFFDAFFAAAPSALLESTRALSPILDAYGKTMAYRNGGTREETIDRLGDNDFGPLLTGEIEKLAPDPHTTGAAAQVVYGITKLVGKAAGYAALGGPVGAAVGTGIDEGINEAMRLQDKGVDAQTAAKAGAVHGAVMGANIALPVAGKTLAQTAGIALASGPVSFIGENAAIASILDAADYGAIAQQYDPLDPIGLSVSTVAPLLFGFGAHALRASHTKTSPAPQAETEAAARTLLKARQAEEASLAPANDFAARSAHADALEAAARSLDAGEPVRLDGAALALDPEKAAAAARRIGAAAEAIESRAPLHPADDAALQGTDTPLRAEDRFNEFAHVGKLIAEQPDMPVFTGAIDEQGQPVLGRAADLWAEAEDDFLRAGEARKAFAAAIHCLLRHPA